MTTRREFIETLASAAGAVVLLPSVTSCKKSSAPQSSTIQHTQAPLTSLSPPPLVRPESWNPVEYNRQRGVAGAIPTSYHKDINGLDGNNKHLGKHLPYLPTLDSGLVPSGFLPIMWGDPSKGHAQHPNAIPGPANNNEGHWYNWIKLRKAVEGHEDELKSDYSAWPTLGEGDNGKYVAAAGQEVTADNGIHTIYLAAIPEGIHPGDTLRVWAHCLTHGEYVDFITV